MGNYPFPSTYILNGQGTLPAWPVRVACESLNFPLAEASNASLLEGLRDAVSIYYNYTTVGEEGKEEALECFDLAAGVNEESLTVENHWTYQFCTEMFMPSGSDGVRGKFCFGKYITLLSALSCEKLSYWEARRGGGFLHIISSEYICI
jgi:lysosomal Pro-X carboxypeptidase